MPGAWAGPLAKETWTQVLTLNASEQEEWDRVEVSMPTLVLPYRSDGLTGEATGLGNGGELGFLVGFYSPESKPLSATDTVRAIRATNRGACYLWAPGTWWISYRCGSTGGLGFGGKLPCAFIPLLPERSAEAQFLGLLSSRTSEALQFSFAGGATGRILTVQQQLDGARAIQIRPDPSGQDFGIRWAAAPAGAFEFKLQNNAALQFEGPTLPLSDLYAKNNAAGARSLSLLVHY